MAALTRHKVRLCTLFALLIGGTCGIVTASAEVRPAPSNTSVASAPAEASTAPAASTASSPAGDNGSYDQLKKNYEALRLDYNNVLAQAKALLVYKNKARDAEGVTQQFDVQKQQLDMEKQQIVKSRDEALAKVASLQDIIKGLNEKIVASRQENEGLKKSFEKASVENIMGEETKKKIADLQADKSSAEAKAADAEGRIRLMEHEALKKDAQAELLRRQISEMRVKYDEAKKNNRILEKKIEEVPRKFAELARENKILVKRTATMHYNLGVFYTQNQEFERALAEFDKAVELNPDDSASYFNLGYLYAEHLQNRAKAVGYFRKFLKLAKKDDKDTDWVKRYILTWQTWEGNEPIK